MTQRRHEPGGSARARMTVVLVGAWIAAAAIAGTPSGASGGTGGEARAKRLPVVVDSGPECFAGKAAPSAKTKRRDH